MSSPMLKPCPFCGAAAYYKEHSRKGEVAIGCTAPGCYFNPSWVIKTDAKHGAIAAWNTRKP